MINWLERVEPNRPFLITPQRVWSYGEAVEEATRPTADEPVFELIRSIAAEGGVTATTSGTTGAPKRVRLTLDNLEAAALASAAHLGHDSDDNWLLAMPLKHVGGMSIVVRQAFTGGSVTELPNADVGQMARAMKGPVTMVSVVPTILRRLVPKGPFLGLRAVLVGGGPIPEGLLEEASAAGLPVLPTYGMTETFGQVATLRPGAPLDYHAHPLPGVEIEIRRGRIAIRSDQVSPDVIDADGWFETSDLGEMSDGALRVLGRADNIIVTGGVNVDPERIEAALAPFVEDVVVIGVTDEEWGEAVTCVYVGPEELEALARDLLHGPLRPKRFVRIDQIPKTDLGKPDRRAVKAWLSASGR